MDWPTYQNMRHPGRCLVEQTPCPWYTLRSRKHTCQHSKILWLSSSSPLSAGFAPGWLWLCCFSRLFHLAKNFSQKIERIPKIASLHSMSIVAFTAKLVVYLDDSPTPIKRVMVKGKSANILVR